MSIVDQQGELVDLTSLLQVRDLLRELGRQEREAVSEKNVALVLEVIREARGRHRELRS